MDLLFASSGIESETARLAPTLKFAGAVDLPVALPGQLLAMKVLSRDPLRRPQDTLTSNDFSQRPTTSNRAGASIGETHHGRGYHRGKDLPRELEALLRKDRSEV